jgi:hypothetical protein
MAVSSHRGKTSAKKSDPLFVRKDKIYPFVIIKKLAFGATMIDSFCLRGAVPWQS